ncbi:MAG TPA: Sec-independent protein translocase protein TatB [Stellaceae bacterium]|nr:Sec-independent protein translocase protein TatB [Stellaceae bacterium]
MFDLAWSHILLLGVVALLVIGPKDLPKALRTVGFWVGKARSIAREFQGSLDQMIREAELEEVRREVEKAATVDVAHSIDSTVDPAGDLKGSFAEPPAIEAEHAAAPESAPAAAPAPTPSAAPPAPHESDAANAGRHDTTP